MNQRMENILKRIEHILKADDEQLKYDMGDEYTKKDKNKLAKMAVEMEKDIAKLFRKRRKQVLAIMNSPVQKDEDGKVLTQDLAAYFMGEIGKGRGEFDTQLKATMEKHLRKNVKELTPIYMNHVDKDVSFNTFSPETNEWIYMWSTHLGDLIGETSYGDLMGVLNKGLTDGESIPEISQNLQNSYGFSRTRAKTIAITETLTANSHSQYEAYKQSPAVSGKQWKHSGGRRIKPRPSHVAYSGTIVPVDDPFIVNGEQGMYPRATTFSPKNRVRCHCAMGPKTDDSILELPPKKKQAMHTKQMEEEMVVAEGREGFLQLTNGAEDDVLEAQVKEDLAEIVSDMYDVEDPDEFLELLIYLRESWMSDSAVGISAHMQNSYAEMFNLGEMYGINSEKTLTPLQLRAAELMREYTVSEIKQHDFTHVKLYRGVKWDKEGDKHPDWVPTTEEGITIENRAVSSWSMNYRVAEDFSKRVTEHWAIMEATVPVEEVWALFDLDGDETEVAVLGATENVKIAEASESWYKQVKKANQQVVNLPPEMHNWLKPKTKKRERKIKRNMKRKKK